MKVEVTTTHEIEIDLKLCAKWFAGLSDEEQAQFFIEVAEEGKKFPSPQSMQWFLVGRHLRTCDCATYASRDLIQSIHDGMTP